MSNYDLVVEQIKEDCENRVLIAAGFICLVVAFVPENIMLPF